MARYKNERLEVGSLPAINSELEKIGASQEDHLSRKPGDSPNAMETNLDMNSFRIVNLPAPTSSNEPLRQADIDLAQGQVQNYVDQGVAGINTAIGNATTTLNGLVTDATTQAGLALGSANLATTEANRATTEANRSQTEANRSETEANKSAQQYTLAFQEANRSVDAADAAEASFINFNKRFLGVFSADPSLDNQGAALQEGALYYNSVNGVSRVYTSSTWVNVSSNADSLAAAQSAANALTQADRAASEANAADNSATFANNAYNDALLSSQNSAQSATASADSATLASGFASAASTSAVNAEGFNVQAQLARDYLEQDLFHYITDDTLSVRVGIGTQVLVSESTIGYPSVLLELNVA